MQNDIESLVKQGRYRDALSALDTLPALSISQKTLRVYLLSQCEGPASVADQASALLDANLSPIDRGRCLEVLGRANGHNGDFSNGIRLLEEAVRTVHGHACLVARSEFQLVLSTLSWLGVEAALTRLSRLRKAVTASGDGYSTVGFHLLCAEVETKRGNRAGAEHHLATAAGLLDRFPHLWQEARLLLLRSNHASFSSDLRTALELAEVCLEKSDTGGFLGIRAVIVSNIGYFLLQTGQLAKAPNYLNSQRARFGVNGPNGVNEGAHELDLALAQGDLERASALAQSLQEVSLRLEGGHSYYGLWYLLVRVKWLLRIGQCADALRTVEDALPFAERTAARSLCVPLRLLAAESAARTGDIESALAYLAETLKECDLAAEQVAEIFRVAAIVSSDQPARRERQFARATRVFEHAGFMTASAEVARNRQDASSVIPAEAIPDDAASRVAEVVESWLTIADVLSTPELAGKELLALLRATGAAHSGTLVRTARSQSSVVARDHWSNAEAEDERSPRVVTSIELGGTADESWHVDVVARPDAASRLTILEIDALLRRLRRRHESDVRDSLLDSLFTDDTRADPAGMVTAADSTRELLTITRRVAASNVTVLFTGETGTGKELLARALHEASPRRAKPFIPFNCTAVAREMVDSQLFGYRRGAFTGAHDAFPGVIRAAAGGTLFLDEIGEISLDVQPKLLRFLESGEIHPLGEPKPITVDVRVVAATNANLEDLVAQGRFREDLFYRLNVVRLQVPPLRERREEIPLLVRHFLDTFSREAQKTGIRVADETLEYLILFAWPGNVRQLANEVRRLVALAESGAVLMPEHLSPPLAASRRTVPPSERDPAPSEFVVRMDQPLAAAIEHLERSMIQYALASAGDRLEDAADLLGISRKGLYLKRLRFKMADAPPQEDDAHGGDARAKKIG